MDVKSLQDKLKYAENKMAEYRNQTSLLKQELKMVHKVCVIVLSNKCLYIDFLAGLLEFIDKKGDNSMISYKNSLFPFNYCAVMIQ